MKNLKLNDKVTVFDQTGVITDVVDKTRELAEYAGKQFIEIWRDFIFA